jgi:hypothetical protein
MNLFFKYYPVNDHSKYYLHHGNYNDDANHESVCQDISSVANDSSFDDQKWGWDCFGTISPFHIPAKDFNDEIYPPETMDKKQMRTKNHRRTC